MSRNGYLERRKNQISSWRRAEKETYIQFMTDTLIDTLNDPEVMGKDVFGQERILGVIHGWQKKFRFWHPALEKRDDTDWYRKRFDDKIRGIVGDENFTPFEDRYEWAGLLDDL